MAFPRILIEKKWSHIPSQVQFEFFHFNDLTIFFFEFLSLKFRKCGMNHSANLKRYWPNCEGSQIITKIVCQDNTSILIYWLTCRYISRVHTIILGLNHTYFLSRTTDTEWRHKSKKSENLGRCGRQNILRSYLKFWDWELIFGRAMKAISSPGVRSPWY